MVLDLVAVAGERRNWSAVPASDLFAEFLAERGPRPVSNEPDEGIGSDGLGRGLRAD